MSDSAGFPPASAPPSDADLAAASRSGDSLAYATLSRRHLTAARSLARLLIPRRAEANDVVAQACAEALDVLRRGDDLNSAFRPYLLAAVRRVAEDRHPPARDVTDPDAADRNAADRNAADRNAADPVVADPVVADPERAVVARAFASLPERWQAVLWHTEIEGARPAEVAPLLGLNANGAAVLAYRAREGLRQAYLQLCPSDEPRDEGRPGPARLGDVNVLLRNTVAPLILGSATAGYLAAAARSPSSVRPAGSAASARLAGGRATRRQLWLRHAPKGQQAATAGVAVAAVAIAVASGLTAVTLTAHRSTVAVGAPAHRSLPPTAAPAPAAQPLPSSQAPRTTSQAPHSQPTPGFPPSLRESSSPLPAPTAPAPAASTAPAPAASTASAAKAPRPAVSSRAHAPSPAVVRPSRLATRIDLVGALPQGATGIVSFTVTNSRPVAGVRLEAKVTLPPGVSYVAAGATATIPGGWSCMPSAYGASCTRGPLAAGTSSTSYLPVAIAADAPAGRAPAISVRDGGGWVSARGTAGVTAVGFPAQFAASGRYAVVTVGSRLVRAPLAGSGGFPLARIGSANLPLPGRVVWAGLYWAWAAGPAQEAIELRGPGGHYQRAAGTSAAMASLGVRGRPEVAVRQAFADVTGLVDRYGAGSWRAAVGPVAGSGSREAGAGTRAKPGGPKSSDSRRASAAAGYLGWTLVVVVADNTAPAGQVMVLGGVRQVDAADPHFSASLGGLTAGRAVRVKAVRWTADGPRASAFTRPSAGRPAVSFTAGAMPYLVGVITATDSREQLRP